MSWVSRLVNVFRSERVGRNLDDELQFHIEARAEEFTRRGMTPAEAERQARRQLGNRLLLTETSREVKLIPWIESILHDARFGLRMLRKNKVVTAAAVLSLGLAIGACTGAFSLIDALLLRPLPVAEPERLFQLSYPDHRNPNDKVESKGFSYPNLELFRRVAGSQTDLFAVSMGGPLRDAVFEGSGGAEEKVRPEWVSVDALRILGIGAARGRVVLEADDRRAFEHPAAVLSYPFWIRRFGGSTDVLGRWVLMNGKQFQIASVAQRGFTGLEPGYLTDLWVPLMTQVDARAFSAPDRSIFQVWGRPKGEIAPEQAREVLQTAFTNFRRDQAKNIFPANTPTDLIPKLINARLNLNPAGKGAFSLLLWQFQRPLLILGVVALLVLLIACSNVANLFIARAAAREREMAMRISIGAGRARLVQQLLIESGLVASAACLLGLVFARAVAPEIVNLLAPADYPSYLDLQVDWRLVAFLAWAGVSVTLFLGIAPALRASSASPDAALKSGGGNQSARIGLLRPLVAVQVGFSFVVLFLGGLLILTFRNLTNVDLGFKKENVVLAGIDAQDRLRPDREPATVLQILESVRQLPGIQSAGMSSTGLVGGPWAWLMRPTSLLIEGRDSGSPRPAFMEASPGFFETMQIRLLAGRDFSLQMG